MASLPQNKAFSGGCEYTGKVAYLYYDPGIVNFQKPFRSPLTHNLRLAPALSAKNILNNPPLGEGE